MGRQTADAGFPSLGGVAILAAYTVFCGWLVWALFDGSPVLIEFLQQLSVRSVEKIADEKHKLSVDVFNIWVLGVSFLALDQYSRYVQGCGLLTVSWRRLVHCRDRGYRRTILFGFLLAFVICPILLVLVFVLGDKHVLFDEDGVSEYITAVFFLVSTVPLALAAGKYRKVRRGVSALVVSTPSPRSRCLSLIT